jgi:hypothetical protein
VPFANVPLRRNPNDAAAIIAATVARGHCTSVRTARITRHDRAHILNSGERQRVCQWARRRSRSHHVSLGSIHVIVYRKHAVRRDRANFGFAALAPV